MTTQVHVQNEAWEPLIGVTVEAIDADEGTILATGTTDLGGIATFDETAFGTERYFFRPQIIRDTIRLLVVPPFGQELYGVDDSEQYVDGRQSWAVVETGAPAEVTHLRTMSNGYLFHIIDSGIGDAGSLYRSVDDGATWTIVTPPAAYSCFGFDEAASGRLWTIWTDEAGDERTFVYYSDSYGDSWVLSQTILSAGLGFNSAVWIKCHPTNAAIAGICRVRPIGSGTKFFAGTTFPSADSSGVEVSTDSLPGTGSGMMLFAGNNLIVATQRGTGGSTRIRLHLSDDGGGTFSVVYEKAPGGDVITWSQLAYGSPTLLFACYHRATGGSGLEGLLRSTDAGATWEELDLPTGHSGAATLLYDRFIDALYLFGDGVGSSTYWKLPSASTALAADANAAWQSLTGPTAGFAVGRRQQVTLVTG